eukprot:Colp12_sorted_trinity150504_noHs@4255
MANAPAALKPAGSGAVTLHIKSPKSTTLRAFVEMIRCTASGYAPLALIPYDQWLSSLREVTSSLLASGDAGKHALTLFLPVFSSELATMTDSTLLCESSMALLETLGVQCPDIDQSLLAVYFDWMRKVGFVKDELGMA